MKDFIVLTDSTSDLTLEMRQEYGIEYVPMQYIIDDGETLQTSKFECAYRAVSREELTKLLMAKGCREVTWLQPEESGFYQPVVIGKK